MSMVEEEKKRKGRPALGWYVKYGDYKKAAQAAEEQGMTRAAKKLKKMAEEERQ